MQLSLKILSIILISMAVVAPSTGLAQDSKMPSRLAHVVDQMRQQKPVTIAFFGGSITWGATATDPLKTSWRALVMKHLRKTYPHTPLEFVDAAIGGQPSRLGVFRMDRDVLPYKPDLVFLEFSINDGDIVENDESYEGVIRKLQRELPGVAIVPVVLGGANGEGKFVSSGRENDLKIIAHYGLPAIDIVPRVAEQVQNGLDTKIILTDRVHPSDAGYALYAELIIGDFQKLAKEHVDLPAAPAQPLTANRFENAKMIELAKLPLSDGWKSRIPAVVGTWFDHTPSRWFDSVVEPLAAGAALPVPLPGGSNVTGLGLYYERQPSGTPVVVRMDGQEHFTAETDNTLQFARVNYRFEWLKGEKVDPKVELQAPTGAPAAVAYLLYTTGVSR